MATNSAGVKDVVLKFSCADRPGIVADVARFFSERDFNIRESSQYEDPDSRCFFMRTVLEWVGQGGEPSLEELRRVFAAVADQYGMQWELHDRHYRPRALIAVSQWGHCLNSLLNSWKHASLPVEIVGVVSNHRDLQPLVEWYGVPYYYRPVTADTKAGQEEQIRQLYRELGADFLVLARYMQILGDDLCRELAGRAINIHHSFLPGFKGAKPYHQAHARGVKLIGATAHYVTAELDEGPIIEQAVERVSHAHTPAELVDIGRDIEALVLQRAVRWHAEHRVLLNGQRTVVFNR